MTIETFEAFYPQFASFSPAIVATTFIDQANARFSSFKEDAEEARRLYVAHKLTLYAQTAPPAGSIPTAASSESGGNTLSGDSGGAADSVPGGSLLPGTAPSLEILAASGEKRERVASKKVGEVAVSYSSSSSSSSASSSSMADLPETTYGLQLLSLVRLHAMPVYVP